MVNRRRELVIMDFGLARIVGGEEALTRTGNVLGTALYMAPEQAAGDLSSIGPACDVYSLGVILYELLTGSRPFEGPWSLVIGLKNVKDPDPPSTHRPALSPALDAICQKAIARDPKDRYASMTEFAGAGRFPERASVPAPEPRPAPSGKTSPARQPESLSVQVFAGLITQEVTSLRQEKTAALPRAALTEGSPPRLPRRAGIIATAGAVVLLGVIIYVSTDKGRIKIEVHDPKAVVKIDGKEVLIEGLGEPVTLRAGDHEYQVKWGNGEFKTDKFVVRRGDNEDLRIEYERKISKIVQSKKEKAKEEPVGKAIADRPEAVMKGDEDEKPKAVAQVPPAKDSPVGEGGQPAKPAMEEGKADRKGHGSGGGHRRR